MLVRCPKCRIEFRLAEYPVDERVVQYLCPGCRTIVSLDLQLDEVRSTSSSGSYQSLARLRTVLVADDSRAIRAQVGGLLRDEGFRVVEAASGSEALAALRKQHPDLVVLDLLMPQMTGFDVLRAMQRDERIRDTPALVISSVWRSNVRGLLHELGARDFLEKDRLADELVARVRRALGLGVTC